jgi:hypothetical protein
MKLGRHLLIGWLTVLGGLVGAHADTRCPDTADITSTHFVGDWAITLAATPGQKPERGVLKLQAHPIYSDSLKGSLLRGTVQWQIVADWEDDTLTLEESLDGEHISATWQARPVAGQCARVLEGIRFTGSEPDAAAQRFRMRSDSAR